MIGIFILIFAYRYYASLAERFGKVKWQYGLLAIGIYLGTQLFFGLFYGIYLALTDPEEIDNINYTGFSGVNLIGWLLSIAAVYGIYKFLENRFLKERLKGPAIEIQDIGKKED
ncbi:hypothetical protein [Kaistella faecalis]|uniref:hypothetical protein n=1 Tax=Kaistella faecalis TaxID=2852098 RepID=UPI001C46F1EC|nr:hypothetical protein [Chryseobacterium faecale]UFK98491.1 hypothetical protein LL667_03820 [Chryseobacterium faecale]